MQTDRLSDTRDDLTDTRSDLAVAEQRAADQQAQIRELEEELAAGGAPGDNPLEDLFGGAAPGGENPLEDLLDPEDLEELFGEQGLEDLFGEGGLEDLLGEGGLEDLLGAAEDAPDVNACLADVEDLPDVDADTLEGQFEQVAEIVQTLRGQTFPEPFTPTIRTAEEIREFFAEEIAEAYSEEAADADQRILGALGAVPTGTDLIQLQTDLLGDQVAGYYDDETGELVVRAESGDDPLGGIGLITLAHEFEHALVDSTIGLPDLEGFGDDEDGALAALSMVEGSAVALQSRFQTSALDPFSLLGDLDGLDQGLDEVPFYLRESLTFPYVEGATYICSQYAVGGWDAVNALIAQPPATSHEVLFPTGVTGLVDVPQATIHDGFDEVTRRSFGAAQLSWLFGAPATDEALSLSDPVSAVESWRGGEVTLSTAGEDSAVAVVLAGGGLCDPVTEWWGLRAGGSGETGDLQDDETLTQQTDDGFWGAVSCNGDTVRVGIGPDLTTARAAIG